MDLLIHLLRDAAVLYSISTQVGCSRDVSYITGRVAHEGLPFLTVTLPTLGKALDSAMSTGNRFVLPPGIRGKKTQSGAMVPCFMHEYFAYLDDCWEHLCSAQVDLDDPIWERCANAVRTIRQVCYLFYKLRLPYTREQETAALERVQAVDVSLPHPDDVRDLSKEARNAVENAKVIIESVLCGSMDVLDKDFVPRHGKGAVATREKPWQKYGFSRFYPNLDRVFPYADLLFMNYSHLADRLEVLSDMTVEAWPMSRAAVVPKDSRGPRVISMEPLEVMYIQQALWSKLRHSIESSVLTQGHVNFTDQTVNQNLCRNASISRESETLDLKDASDRVSIWLVEQLFPEPWIQRLLAARSSHCDYAGTIVELRKFAPMGSATCFPVESLIFFALAAGAQVPAVLTYDQALAACASTYVYGDDLIVPKGCYELVRRVFAELSLELNEDKCCISDFPFRESCGYDAFAGYNVTPLRIKHRWCNKLSPQALMAWCKYQNWLALSPYARASHYVTQRMLDQPHHLLNVNNRYCEAHPYVLHPDATWTDVLSLNAHLRLRWNTKLHKYEYRATRTAPVTTWVTHDDGWQLLFDRCTRGFDPSSRPVCSRKPGKTGKRELGNWCEHAIPNRLKFGFGNIDLSQVLETEWTGSPPAQASWLPVVNIHRSPFGGSWRGAPK